MSQYKSKTLAILLLGIVSILSNNFIAYALSLLAPVISHARPLILTLLGIISIWAHHITEITVTKVLATLILLSIYIWYRNSATNSQKQTKEALHNRQIYLIFLYLIGFSVVTLGRQTLFQDCTLIVFFILLLIFQLAKFSVLRVVILVMSMILGIWSLGSFGCTRVLDLSGIEGSDKSGFSGYCDKLDEKQWYYYLAVTVIGWISKVLYSISKQPQKTEQNQPQYIQMQEISKTQLNIQQGQRDLSEKQEQEDRKELPIKQNQQNYDQKQIKSHSQKSMKNKRENYTQKNHVQASSDISAQSQLTNIFLLLPFTLFHLKELEIPIYLYIFLLQYNKSSTNFFYLMLASVCTIAYLTRPSTLLQFLLRLCLIFIVNKNFQLAINFTRAVRTIWLRSSFVIVLVIFFWFSLLTVNLFHIVFVITVLLFITKDGRDEEHHQHSFRNRNWIYLMIAFDVFLMLRLLFSIAIEYKLQMPTLLDQLLALLGISYKYGANQSHFNLIPLMISGIITTQYWTYTSRIYNIQKDQLSFAQPTYKILFRKIINILKICYYKLIPWFSHFLVLFIVLQLEFSVITCIVSLWSVGLLWSHMVMKNDLSAYRILYARWMMLLRMLAVEIILRYIFQLLKFPFIYSHIGKLPFIEYLIQYQQILGLVIRESSTSYLKNIFTKFQIMIGLDFTFIAISFLAIEYYQILIKYEEIQKELQERSSLSSQLQERLSNQQIQYIYINYIDFKLTLWLKSYNIIMLYFSKILIKLYYFLLATYACFNYSFASFFYFICAIAYYLAINRWYYRTDVLEGRQNKVHSLFAYWRKYHSIEEKMEKDSQKQKQNEDKRDQLEIIQQRQMEQINVDKEIEDQRLEKQRNKKELKKLTKKIKQTNQIEFENIVLEYHQNLRPLILLITMIFIMVTYASKILHTAEINSFLEKSDIQFYRYFVYIMGTSYQTKINLIPYLIIVILTLIELKCCSLLKKNIDEDLSTLKTQKSVSKEIAQRNDSFLEENKFKPSSRKMTVDLLFKDKLDQDQEERSNSCVQKFSPGDSRIIRETIIEPQDEVRQDIRQEKREIDKKFIDMDISLRLGMNKMLERLFVILLVFVSILEDQNPFSIIYLCLAWLLNYLGNNSIQGLSYTLSVLVIGEYSLIITDMTNPYLGVINQYPQYATGNRSWLIKLLSIENEEWISYLSYGFTISEFAVLYLSVLILVCYQFVFWIEQYNWIHILERIYKNRQKIEEVKHKLYTHLIGVYQYALVYSPICITVLCLGLYFIDFTATNMFLGVLSILFVYKSFLFQNYTESRDFWKSYFQILQLMIIIFMVIYCILTTPMYSQYCNQILCSQEEFRTKVTKTILLLILQIGIDLISSRHFEASMTKLRSTINQTSSYYKLSIAYVQNDEKILRIFKLINKKNAIKLNIEKVQNFLSDLKHKSSLTFENNKQKVQEKNFWLNTALSLLKPSIDSQLIKTPSEVRHTILKENKMFINWLEEQKGQKLQDKQLIRINEIYVDEFQKLGEQSNQFITSETKLDRELALIKKIDEIIEFSQISSRPTKKTVSQANRLFEQINQEEEEKDIFSERMQECRKSYIDENVPFDPEEVVKMIYQRSVKISQDNQGVYKEEKEVNITEESVKDKKVLYLLIFESVLSNWHYLTYFLMVLEFVYNMGICTVMFPVLTFAYGMINTHQASKSVWRISFLALILPIFVKYSLSIGLITLSKDLTFLIIGSHSTSIFLEYLLICFIIVQCSILKVVGLYDQTASEVQCMKMALIRNILNIDSKNQKQKEERDSLRTLLSKCSQRSSGSLQYIFSRKQFKRGYDYSTVMVTIQITILVYIFCFYEKMAIREELTFYKMIEYNQFSTGMVIMAFVQLGFILLERILNVVEFNENYLWDFTIICKYFLMLASMVLIHGLVLVFFPFNSDSYESNTYVIIFYILNSFYFLISSLQIRYGVDKQSRGFMERYTWYNGFIYMFYRAIPFLFQFKIFSDWTFTNTSLRLFDWIKFQEILGFLYVAKCNSLFLSGKILGSKIEWWKKLLMGFPLLMAIILLLFGPLVLFSSLNPLASLNEISGGYFELSLRINKTNQYPLYINTHITDITFLQDAEIQNNPQIKQIIKNNQIDPKSIQRIHLQLYSDQYWEISEGSYQKLINEPESSLYELSMRVKFQRNYTGTTPIYLLNKKEIPENEIQKFKQTLKGEGSFTIDNFFPEFIRLDNNNGIHYLSEEVGTSSGKIPLKFHAEIGKKTLKKYWVIDDGLNFKISSDKYSKAIFGYSVMSFYISIILVVANYFRFLFQGSAYNIILSDIPYPDPILSICDGVYQARARNDIKEQQILFWTLIDIMRSPDTIKALAGNYLDARLETTKDNKKKSE